MAVGGSRVEKRDLIAAYLISRRRLRAGLASRSRIVRTALGSVEYVDEGAGPVIVRLHGMLGGIGHSRWCRVLVQAGFRVITPSRPGYLRTPLSCGKSPAEKAALVAALLDALEVDRVAFYACSQGGAAALRFALAYPQRCWGLVLFSAFTRPHPEMAKILPYMRMAMALDFLLWLLKPILLPRITAPAKKALANDVCRDGEKRPASAKSSAPHFKPDCEAGDSSMTLRTWLPGKDCPSHR